MPKIKVAAERMRMLRQCSTRHMHTTGILSVCLFVSLKQDDDAPGVFNKMPTTSVCLSVWNSMLLKDVSCMGNSEENKNKFIDRPTSDYEELVIKTLLSTTDLCWWFQSYDM
jgi:hypothetical protein